MDKILNEIKKISMNNNNVEKISLFGSRARGDHSHRSDIDIAIYFKDAPDYDILSQLEDIETLLKIDVTIVTRELSERFLQNLKTEEIVLFMGKFANKYDNFSKAVKKLEEIKMQPKTQDKVMMDIIRDSAIQRFEFCYELAWKTLREYMIYNGLSVENMPRPVFKAAYQHSILDNQEIWLEMIKDRNVASHEYNEDYIIAVASKINSKYTLEFVKLAEKLGKEI